MATENIDVTKTWTLLAEDTDAIVLISSTYPGAIQYATTATEVEPEVEGHTLNTVTPLTRDQIGTGFIWGRVGPDEYIGASTPVVVVVTK